MFLVDLLKKQSLIFFEPEWLFVTKLTVFFVISIISVVTDIKKQKINSKLLLVFLLLSVVLSVFFDRNSLLFVILGIFATSGIFFLIYIVSRGGIGLGDIIYIVFFTSIFGIYFGILALLFGFWLAFLVIIIPFLLKKINRSVRIPLVPFLFLGGVCSLLLGWILK